MVFQSINDSRSAELEYVSDHDGGIQAAFGKVQTADPMTRWNILTQTSSVCALCRHFDNNYCLMNIGPTVEPSQWRLKRHLAEVRPVQFL